MLERERHASLNLRTEPWQLITRVGGEPASSTASAKPESVASFSVAPAVRAPIVPPASLPYLKQEQDSLAIYLPQLGLEHPEFGEEEEDEDEEGFELSEEEGTEEEEGESGMPNFFKTNIVKPEQSNPPLAGLLLA
jgi:hypothetical protein